MSARLQMVNPLTGERISITRRSTREAAEVKAKCARVFDDARDGHLAAGEALERVAQILRGQVRALTIDDVFDAWIATKRDRERLRVAAYWRLHLAPHFAGLHPLALTEERMRAWWEAVGHANKGKAPLAESTRLTVLAQLHAAIALAVRSERLSHVPWRGWRPPAPYRRDRAAATSEAALERLLEAAYAADRATWPAYSDLSYRLGFLLLTGLRQGEAAGLGWDHVLLDADRPRVIIEWQTKDGWRAAHPEWDRPRYVAKARRDREVRIGPACVALLRAQRAQLERHGVHDAGRGPVFPSFTPGLKSEWRALACVIRPERMRELARTAGLPDADRWTTHATRHTFVTLTARSASAGNLRDLMSATGHSSPEMLMRYMHQTGELGPELGGRLFLDPKSFRETPRRIS